MEQIIRVYLTNQNTNELYLLKNTNQFHKIARYVGTSHVTKYITGTVEFELHNNIRKYKSVVQLESKIHDTYIIIKTEEMPLNENQFPIISEYDDISEREEEMYIIGDVVIKLIKEVPQQEYYIELNMTNKTDEQIRTIVDYLHTNIILE